MFLSRSQKIQIFESFKRFSWIISDRLKVFSFMSNKSLNTNCCHQVNQTAKQPMDYLLPLLIWAHLSTIKKGHCLSLPTHVKIISTCFKINKKRHELVCISCALCQCSHNEFWIFGQDQEIYFPDYPGTNCCGCCCSCSLL